MQQAAYLVASLVWFNAQANGRVFRTLFDSRLWLEDNSLSRAECHQNVPFWRVLV